MGNTNDINNFYSNFFNLVENSKDILITSHMRPDDDSISSVLSIYEIIKEKYPQKNVKIIYSGDVSKRWNYFKNYNVIESDEDIYSLMNEFDLAIFTDASESLRFSKNPDLIKDFKGNTICIEHHKNQPESFTLLFHDNTAISTADIIYRIFIKERKEIPQYLAEVILLGVLGDSGNLRFIRPEHGEVFDLVKRVVTENKIDIQQLKSKYEKYSQNTYLLIKKLIDNSELKEVEGWPKFLSSYISRDYISENNFNPLEVNEASHIFIQMFGLSIEGINWALVLYPLENSYKGSLRSLPQSVNVRKMAQDIGLGGGHDRAAGITISGDKQISHEDALKFILDWMKDNKPTLE